MFNVLIRTPFNLYNDPESNSKENQYYFSERVNQQDSFLSTSKVNTDRPMHKGQKYEPVSVMLYEHNYDTEIEDFGCITHEQYNFLGASPDGINCN